MQFIGAREKEKRAAADAEEAREKEKRAVETATLLFEHVESQIRLADTKAQFILAVDTLLLISFPLANRSPLPTQATAFFIIVMSILLASPLASLFFALWAVRPRRMDGLRNLIEETKLPLQTGELYQMSFGRIARLGTPPRENEKDSRFPKFKEIFSELNPQFTRDLILSELYIKAAITEIKYRWLRWSICCLYLALACWVAARVILATNGYLF
jgi:hypothetical protein